ncbi:ABC transporter permease [Natrialba swarupiae]|nr:ABC transporter permease [Natrialba swarupiae]
MVPEFTLANYQRLFGSSTYPVIIAKSFLIGLVTTLIVLPLGYTLGYFLGRTESTWKPLLLGLVVVQFWVPIIIRTYAWIPILGTEGVVNQALLWIGLINEPLSLLYTMPGMLVGLVVSLLPFMILPVYAAVSTIDDDVIQAAKTLGASDWRAFWEVTLPLSWPGIVSGILFTFIIAAGAFLARNCLAARANG